MVFVHCLRHAQADHNVAATVVESPMREEVYRDPKYFNAALSEQGTEAARKLSLSGLAPPMDAVLVSPLLRTLQTWAMVASSMPWPKLCLATDHLREYSRSGNYHPCDKRFPKEETTTAVHFPSSVDWSCVPEGPDPWLDLVESSEEVQERVRKLVCQLADLERTMEARNILLVSHAGLLRQLFKFLGLEEKSFANLELAALSVQFNSDGSVAHVQLADRAAL
jgi:broad specificity phosphatase PhoE